MSWSKKALTSIPSKVLIAGPILFLMLIIVSTLLTSCQTEVRPSILIIAFDQFSHERLNCNDEKTQDGSGFSFFCKESFQFSHVYTTSLQPAASLGSILSAEYPYKNKLHRSFDRIDFKTQLTPYVALQNGYRTSFFGGNPHTLKKTGLSKGFEFFDDSAAAFQSQFIIKDFKTSSDDFLRWQQEDPDKPFFSVITNSELDSFSEVDAGSSSYEKIDEKLFQFVTQLKQSKIWEKSYIILVGLKGFNNYNRPNETSYLNLHSENSMVNLFIKPPRMKGDDGTSWKVDFSLSLVDLGKTLRSLVTHNSEKSNDDDSDFSAIDLTSLIKYNKPLQTQDRTLLIEAIDNSSAPESFFHYAFYNNNYLYIAKPDANEIYNLVTDSFETNNVFLTENEIRQNFNDIIANFKNIFKYKQKDRTIDFDKQVLIAKEFITNSSKNSSYLSQIKLTPANPLIVFQVQNQIKKDKKTMDFVIASKVAKDCYSLIAKENVQPNDLKKCTDDLFLDYIRFKKAKNLDLNQEKMKIIYSISKKQFYEEAKLAIINLAMENIWGIYNPNKNWLHPLIYIDDEFFSEFKKI